MVASVGEGLYSVFITVEKAAGKHTHDIFQGCIVIHRKEKEKKISSKIMFVKIKKNDFIILWSSKY